MNRGPRKLLVLRINDELRDIDIQGRFHPRGLEPPLVLDALTFGRGQGRMPGIASWLDSVHVWATATPALPDLVVADIVFEDYEHSPLGGALKAAEQKGIPTGLSHLKPFAAVARVLGRPIGIGIHTANPEHWRNLTSDAGRILAGLAAHEIGELAAILGEPAENFDPEVYDSFTHPETKLEVCWRWLQERSRADFQPALGDAVRDYRRRTLALIDQGPSGGLWVAAKDWAELMAWVRRMEAAPEVLAEPADPGLRLRTTSGVDWIRLGSLFADFPEIESRRLPPVCFQINEGARTPAWSLDSAGFPKIGSFLNALGGLARTCDAAAQIVLQFPLDLEERLESNLRARVSHGITHAELVAGFVVLFQYLRHEMGIFELWQDMFRNSPWDPRKLQVALLDEGLTLENILDNLVALICRRVRVDGIFAVDEVFEGDDNWRGAPPVKDAQAPWVKWHFERLVDGGVLEQVPEKDGNSYRLIRKALNLPRTPSPVPKGVMESGDVKSFLMETLGFGEKMGPGRSSNRNAVGQILYSAFVRVGGQDANEKATLGRAFFEDFVNGSSPPWVKESCADFVDRVLQWAPRKTWPRCIVTE